ncbi:hypothetical protein SPRG_04243 [Saprolegnia parasitica CBS 223.65]|uniref:Uncharacterized protein n=1 Tax=Saprolegnia parasitica (strain CBS 223.65) TaxID=695850 RepID=A0A067CK44_SAPPC|nr:hypothetical protein SPRG_04243 [Saprolegnia parasitica CBS 223.65]KDO31104.1 hypothetical protein SPRG_04243 [Saprolegnia parasitica CBS 223.65]|eukprot:XP_012198233.1 hypothetical protein SPRG_04243 [Saprolegnia parasitica CBS 223.65]
MLRADWTASAHYDGPTPLFIVTQNGHLDVVEQLIAAKATVNLVNRDVVTPLYVAVEKRHKMIVDLLLASGADTNGVRQLGLLSVVQKLVVGGANIGHVAANNATARLTALVHEHYDVVAALDHARRYHLDEHAWSKCQRCIAP